jgi:succinate dehydrogenase / fumarate reductase flavoprotein subunit
MSTIPGLFVIGEANFSDHGANRLGASALMQGLCDGYFVIPYTLGNYLAGAKLEKVDAQHPAFQEASNEVSARTKKLLDTKGSRTVDSYHRELGRILWDDCGMARTRAGLEKAIGQIRELRLDYWQNVRVLGSGEEINQSLEKAGRVGDFFELGELMCLDARDREESCGGHFREEHQTPDGEALRDDRDFSYVSAWEYAGQDAPPVMHKEPLAFEYVHPSQRSYK